MHLKDKANYAKTKLKAKSKGINSIHFVNFVNNF